MRSSVARRPQHRTGAAGTSHDQLRYEIMGESWREHMRERLETLLSEMVG